MYPIAEYVILAGGWRRRLIGFAGGAFGALALAPVDFLPAMIVPMTIAVWLIDGAAEAAQTPGARPRSLCGAQCFRRRLVVGLRLFRRWLLVAWRSLSGRAADFVWAMPLGVFGLPAFLALFPALGFALARLGWSPGLRAS